MKSIKRASKAGAVAALLVASSLPNDLGRSAPNILPGAQAV